MNATQPLRADLRTYPLSPETQRFLAEPSIGHLIEGEVTQSLSGETLPVYEPATGLEFARVAAGSKADVDRAVRSAQRAFEDGRWRNVAPADKEKCLHRLAALLEKHRDTLMDLDVLDGGVVRSYSQFIVQFGIDAVDYFAGA